jgi:hypothetical protein
LRSTFLFFIYYLRQPPGASFLLDQFSPTLPRVFWIAGTERVVVVTSSASRLVREQFVLFSALQEGNHTTF